MTAAREHRNETAQTVVHGAVRRVWARPALQRIEAGSAELGSNVVTDAGVTKS